MKLKTLLFFIVTGLCAVETPAQPPPMMITGTVVDTLQNTPVEYANVVLDDAETGKQITGTVTQADGTFKLTRFRPGLYNVEVDFIGYHKQTIEDIRITPDNPVADVGTIPLKQAVLMMEGVEAAAEKAAVEYKIDKKVVNVSKQYTAASGTAVDVLENVPSVKVDIEGNVSLRGSGSFQVLIDGRPSVLDGTDALRQLPASSIEKIEIITNPSAKYDPDGTAGIINVITKKQKRSGFNGMVNVNGGVNDKYGGDVLLNYRNANYNVFLGLDYNHRFFPGTSDEINRTTLGDTTFVVASDGDRERAFTGYSIRTGFEWNITDQDMLGASVRWGSRGFEMNSELAFEEWHVPGMGTTSYLSLGEYRRGGQFGSAQLNYQHDFAQKGHKLVAELSYRLRESDDTSTDELHNMQNEIQSGRKSTEKGPGSPLRAKVDYTLPLNESATFEAGYQSRLGRSTDENEFFRYNSQTGAYDLQSEFSYTTEYRRSIQALYAMYSDELGSFGFQTGLRTEYTGRSVELVDQDQTASLNRWDVFPTLHTSLQLPNEQQMMASYTRRIERPRGYYFEPFITWMDAYNVRRGNPDIKPEYIDSYEAGYQRRLGKNLFSLEGYYRITNNKVERVRSVYRDNVMLHTVDNVGKDTMFGAELMLNMDAFKWWNINLMGNLFDYQVEGVIQGEPFSRSSFNWDTRFNNTFKLMQSTRFQFNLSYNSPSVSAQGKREGFFMTNVALRQSFLDDKLEAILQVRDLFATAEFEFTSEGRDFYTHTVFTREAPVYTITLNYYINNYNRQRQQQRSGGDMDEGFEEM